VKNKQWISCNAFGAVDLRKIYDMVYWCIGQSRIFSIISLSYIYFRTSIENHEITTHLQIVTFQHELTQQVLEYDNRQLY